MDRTTGLILYPRYTALDIIGPYEVLSRVTKTVWIAETLEPLRADAGAVLVPETTFDTAPPLDIVVVPGGPGQTRQMTNEVLLGYLRATAERAEIVASVCTGSLLLAAAGLLAGKRATTHWLAREILAGFGAEPVPDRIVDEGRVVTAAGVSAGIDLALTLVARLYGDEVAQAIQLGIEYDPQPPFDAGSPEKAPAALVESMRANRRAFLE